LTVKQTIFDEQDEFITSLTSTQLGYDVRLFKRLTNYLMYNQVNTADNYLEES